ncbi:MAG: hypothetical protein JWM10_1985 [Myxococcaceae bacterium]|nr:hypothetical protein [Myxococcaceae bacterium]
MSRAATLLNLTLVGIFAGCGPDETPAATSLVPANYAATYPEVRGCRMTFEHISSYGAGAPTISNIRVVLDPGAMANYRATGRALPVGSTVIKEEFADPTCTTVIGWTVMRKEPAGYDPTHGDWHWQRVRASDRAVLEDGRVDRCINCHNTADCTTRDWQCTQP